MSNLNKVMLIGRCAAKPEFKTTKGGKPFAKIRLATNRAWRDEDGEKKTTEWHDVVTWDRLAQVCADHLERGRLVFVEGRISTRSWKDPKGADQHRKEIVANRVAFLGGRGNTLGGDESPSEQQAAVS